MGYLSDRILATLNKVLPVTQNRTSIRLVLKLTYLQMKFRTVKTESIVCEQGKISPRCTAFTTEYKILVAGKKWYNYINLLIILLVILHKWVKFALILCEYSVKKVNFWSFCPKSTQTSQQYLGHNHK